MTGWAPVPLRAGLGLVFLMHGGQKLFVSGISGTAGFMESVGMPLPAVSAVVATLLELVGGLAILLGVGTRVAAFLLAAEMLVAMLVVHARSGFFLPNGVEFVLTLIGGTVALARLGPGPLSVEAAVGQPMA
jgi:putative oxidoreductase